MFSDMTTIGSSSLLTNKHDVSDINKLHLFNVNMPPYNKMILYDIISRIVNGYFVPLTISRRIRIIKDVGCLL